MFSFYPPWASLYSESVSSNSKVLHTIPRPFQSKMPLILTRVGWIDLNLYQLLLFKSMALTDETNSVFCLSIFHSKSWSSWLHLNSSSLGYIDKFEEAFKEVQDDPKQLFLPSTYNVLWAHWCQPLQFPHFYPIFSVAIQITQLSRISVSLLSFLSFFVPECHLLFG